MRRERNDDDDDGFPARGIPPPMRERRAGGAAMSENFNGKSLISRRERRFVFSRIPRDRAKIEIARSHSARARARARTARLCVPQRRAVVTRPRLDPAQQCANTTTRRTWTCSRKRISLLFSGSRFSIARNADRRRQSISPKIHSPRDDQLPLALPPSRGDGTARVCAPELAWIASPGGGGAVGRRGETGDCYCEQSQLR